jgi:hypothetical protein
MLNFKASTLSTKQEECEVDLTASVSVKRRPQENFLSTPTKKVKVDTITLDDDSDKVKGKGKEKAIVLKVSSHTFVYIF